MKMIKTSEMAEETRPMLVEFILALGYNEEQGDKFAEGYLQKAETLGVLEKMSALTYFHDSCMNAGYIAAGIDEDEAFKRFQSIEEQYR